MIRWGCICSLNIYKFIKQRPLRTLWHISLDRFLQCSVAYSVGRLSHRWGFTMLNRKITTSIHYLFTLLLLIFWSVAVNADAIDWMGTQVQVNDSITSTNTMSSTIQSTTEAIATITLAKRTSQLDTTLANQYLNTVADMTTEIWPVRSLRHRTWVRMSRCRQVNY